MHELDCQMHKRYLRFFDVAMDLHSAYLAVSACCAK
jgi:hypothetical protein